MRNAFAHNQLKLSKQTCSICFIIFLQDVSRSNDSDGLVKILREMEALVLMPLKPFYGRTSPLLISNTQQQRHDSGFDSGYENHSNSSGDEDLLIVNKSHEILDIPGQIFDILKMVSTEIFVKEYTNHEVVTVFACLLEKTLKREAYTSGQKQLISGWLQKLKTLWNPPHIKKATDYKKR